MTNHAYNPNIIYCLIDPITCQIQYVGRSSKGLSRPFEQIYNPNRERDLELKFKWITSLHTKGLVPIVRILAIADTKEQLPALEEKYIRSLMRYHPECINVAVGNNTGGAITRRRPLTAINLSTGEEVEYLYIHATAKDGFDPSKVAAVCRRHRTSHKGWTFSYSGTETPIKKNHRIKAITLQNRNTKEVVTFTSIKEAASALRISKESISKLLNGKSKYLRHWILVKNL